MEKIINKLQKRKVAAPRLNRSSQLFTTIIDAIREKKGEAIVSIDLTKIDEAVADYFILCEAQSNVQIKSIAESIRQDVYDQCDELPYHIEHGEQWTLVDYVNVVVHIFQRDYRKFYDLESLWLDGEQKEHRG